MVTEESLRRVVTRKLCWTKFLHAHFLQEFIPLHTAALIRGDQDTRDNFRFLQLWYTRALRISLEQARGYIPLVELRELEGFSIEPIARRTEKRNEEKEESGDNKEEENENDPPENPATVQTYDEDGFYFEDNMEQVEKLDEHTPMTDSYESLSWADEVHDAEAEGRLTPPSSVSDSMTLYEEQEEQEDRPLSQELINTLEGIGASTDIKRTNTVVTLSEEELYECTAQWDFKVESCKKEEASRMGKWQHYEEDAEEADLLDTWDDHNDQFYWQTEGLFLCRLTELAYKDLFEVAKRIWWVEVKTGPKYKAVKNKGPSPLRNEVFAEDL